MIKVYLAGSIDKERWRLQVIKECQDCQIEWLSPIDNVSYNYQSLLKIHKKNKVFHECDRMKVDRADVVLAYMREGGVSVFSGTSFEIGYAYAKGKHIVLVLDMKPSKACLYELVKRMSDVCYNTLEEGIDHLRELAAEMGYVPKTEG